MKTIIFFIITSAVAWAQITVVPMSPGERRAIDYRKRGLSMDPNPERAFEKIPVIRLSEIPQGSPKFQNILATLQTQHPEINGTSMIERVKGGETFTLTKRGTPATCSACSGSGKIYSSAARTADKKEPCSKCKGAGKTSAVSQFKLLWTSTADMVSP